MKTGTDAEMFGALVGIAALSGLLIVGAYKTTLPAIKRNKAARLKTAVFEVIPGAKSVRAFVAPSRGPFVPAAEDTEDPSRVYAGFDAAGALAGIAIEASGQGFQDVVAILYGYSPARQTIIGMKVLESKETPGLGDKIAKDPVFLKNFESLDARLADEGAALANPITAVKHGKKARAWEIDGITGATISSKAVARLLNASAGARLPAIARAAFMQEAP